MDTLPVEAARELMGGIEGELVIDGPGFRAHLATLRFSH